MHVKVLINTLFQLQFYKMVYKLYHFLMEIINVISDEIITMKVLINMSIITLYITSFSLKRIK
jgi:hypothetical protein